MAEVPAFAAGSFLSLFALGAAGADVPMNTQAAMPGGAAGVLSPMLILVLCVVAGLGTFMLLPSRREGAFRRMGGAILLVAGLIFMATLIRTVAVSFGAGMSVYFWVFSSITVFCAVRVVTHRKPVYSALYFVLSVLATAGLFVLLWAEFMAAALVIIYAGAILVTYVFVIMLATQSQSAADLKARGAGDVIVEYDRISREPLAASALGFTLMGVLLFVIFDKAPGGPMTMAPPLVMATVPPPVVPAEGAVITAAPPVAAKHTPGSPQSLGAYLFKTQAVNLELAGLILTVAMVGAILISRRRVEVSAPVTAVKPVRDAVSPVEDNPHAIPVYGTDNPRAKAYPET